MKETHQNDLTIVRADKPEDLPPWAERDTLARFFHETMVPYHDELADVQRGLDYAFSDEPGKGGHVIAAARDGKLVGAVLMLRTGMEGYIPANLLLFISVDPDARGQGIGRRLIEHVQKESDGPIKLHVEADNPALRLYERCGFEAKYLEMRCDKP